MAVRTAAIQAARALLLAPCACDAPTLGERTATAGQFETQGETAPDYLANAQAAHDFTYGNLLTTYGSYRDRIGVTASAEWYNISQLDADAAMIARGDARYQTYMDATHAFMDHFWMTGPLGGYAAATSEGISGGVAIGDAFVDDNSLAGVAYLDAADVTTGDVRSGYIAAARSIANYLMFSGLWDGTYDGGFWWSTQKHEKPTNANGLAMQLFFRLHRLTGESFYLDWGNSIRTWLEARLWQEDRQLFAWQVTANGVEDANFSYDAGIMIEAYLADYATTGDGALIARAEAIAGAMETTLWDHAPDGGGFVINTRDWRLSPVYSGWPSQSLVRLFEVDGDAALLVRARANVDIINARLRVPEDGGYRHACSPDGSNLDGARESVDQAWMQRVQALLSAH
jgi:hypothetical protein